MAVSSPAARNCVMAEQTCNSVSYKPLSRAWLQKSWNKPTLLDWRSLSVLCRKLESIWWEAERIRLL
jgi:hypothetical protein